MASAARRVRDVARILIKYVPPERIGALLEDLGNVSDTGKLGETLRRLATQIKLEQEMADDHRVENRE